MTRGLRANRPRSVQKRIGHENEALLDTCRVVATAAAILILGIGAVYQLAEPAAADPWTLRLIFAAVCVSLGIATNVVNEIRKRCVELTAVVLYLLTAWFIFLTAFNDFSAEYGLGLVFTIAAAGFALLVTQENVRPVLVYALSSTLTVAVLLLAMSPPKANAWLTIGAVAGIGLVIVLSSRLRTALIASLTSSEKRFRKLSEAAFEAIFITDAGRIIDCNTNALDLLGHGAQERLLGCALADFMPHSDRPSAESFGDVEDPYRYESAVIRSDGEVVPVEIRGRSTSEDEHEVRVVAVRDISEQKRYEEELIVSRRQVQETLDVRNTILTNVSHEFRTPLAIILGYAEMLKERKGEDASELGALIYDSGRKLNDTLNLILELAQIEGGGFALDVVEADVSALVDEVLRTYEPRAELKSLDLRFSVQEGEHVAHVDRVRVLKMIDYLLDNALKYTAEGGIDVTVSSDEDWTYVAVVDSGSGIDESFFSELFMPFRQESKGLTRSHGGLGVGLAIAKHMAESMGGRITVESRKDEGSTFIVSLPRGRAARRSSAAESNLAHAAFSSRPAGGH